MRCVLALVLAAGTARADRYAVIGDVGTWPSDHSYRELHTGLDGSYERAAGELVVIGAAMDLQRVWYWDDECYGFRGFRGDAVALIGVDARDPGIASLRYIVQARFGLAWLHEAPSCPMARGSRDLLGADIAGVFGVEVRGVRVQVVVAQPTYGGPNEPIEVTVGVGAVFR